MDTELFNEKTIKRLCSGVKITPKQKKNAEEWIKLLESGVLEKEKRNYFKFAIYILRDILGYSIREDLEFEEANIEFTFKDSIGKTILCIEAKGETQDLFSRQTRTKKEQSTPFKQTWDNMGRIDTIKYGICTNYRDFILIDKSRGYSKYHFFNFLSIKNNPDKLKEFIAIFSKASIIDKEFIETLYEKSIIEEREFTKQFYKLFHETRLMLIEEFQDNGASRDESIHFAQIFLNRLMFVFFAEDTGKLKQRLFEDMVLNLLKVDSVFSEKSHMVCNLVKSIFENLNEGSERHKIFGFNGGLFKEQIPEKIYFMDFRKKEYFNEIYQHSTLKKEIILDERSKAIIDLYHEGINPITINLLYMASFDFNTEVSVYILGHIFEQSISDLEELQEQRPSRRRKEGVFYTPDFVTDYVCRNTIIPYLSKKGINNVDKLIKEYSNNIEELEEKFKNLKILDPACGSGSFLLKAVEILLEIYKEVQIFKESIGEYSQKQASPLSKRRSKKIRKEQLTFTKFVEEDEAREIIENNIFGVDINEESVEITKLSLFFKIAKKNKKLIDLSSNIKCGNSLINEEEIGGNKSFSWESEFPFKFDIIIGNPPYVRSREFSEEETTFINNQFDLVKSGFDLSTLFIEKGLSLLHNEGILGFISSNKFFSASYGKLIRKYLIDTKLINNIINFGSGVFEDTPVETSILIIDKKSKNDIIRYGNYIKIKKISKLLVDKKIEINDYNLLPANIFFFPKDKKEEIALDKLKIIDTKVENFYKFTAGAGITGIKDKLKDEEISGSIPVFTGKSIWRYYDKHPEYWIDPSEIKIFETNKIVLVRELSTKNRANIILNYKKIGLLNSVTIVESKLDNIDVKSFAAIFNSKIFDKIYSLLYESTRTHSNLRFKEIYLNPIPLPNISNSEVLAKKVNEITNLNKEFHKKINRFIARISSNLNLEKITKRLERFYELSYGEFLKELFKQKINLNLRQQDEWEDYFNKYKEEIIRLQKQINDIDKDINQMVYKLYRLSKEEIEIVENSL